MICVVCISLVIWLSAPLSLWSQSDSTNQVIPDIRRVKIEQMMAELRSFQPAGETPRVEPVIYDSSETRGAGYRILGEGLIDMRTNGWVFIRLKSAHDQPAVGDVMLAIDHQGLIYENSDHVCGQVAHFESVEKMAASDPEDFFARFHSDISHQKWIKQPD